MATFLEGKRILFLSVKFFQYEQFIKEELEAAGASVDWFDERPSNSFYTKAILRIKKSFYAQTIQRYYQSLIESIQNNHYDYFFLVKGEAVPVFFIEFLRKNNPGIKTIFYTWDSLKNSSNCLEILHLFDEKFSFDADDAQKYGMKFRPLFFARLYDGATFDDGHDSLYDLAFIGTAHSDRYTIAEKIVQWCTLQRFKTFTFYYSPSKLLFWFKKILDRNFRCFDSRKISFHSLGHRHILEIYQNAKVVLDINHPAQKGLTMRTFEVLGAGRKLITTNEAIKSYPFYDANNILVIDRGNPVIDREFFSSRFHQIPISVRENMSLRGWIQEIFMSA